MLDERRTQLLCPAQEGLARSCGLNMRSWTRKYSQTGPVTVKPVPSARPRTFTTSAMTPATIWTSYAVMSGCRRSPYAEQKSVTPRRRASTRSRYLSTVRAIPVSVSTRVSRCSSSGDSRTGIAKSLRPLLASAAVSASRKGTPRSSVNFGSTNPDNIAATGPRRRTRSGICAASRTRTNSSGSSCAPGSRLTSASSENCLTRFSSAATTSASLIESSRQITMDTTPRAASFTMSAARRGLVAGL